MLIYTCMLAYWYQAYVWSDYTYEHRYVYHDYTPAMNLLIVIICVSIYNTATPIMWKHVSLYSFVQINKINTTLSLTPLIFSNFVIYSSAWITFAWMVAPGTQPPMPVRQCAMCQHDTYMHASTVFLAIQVCSAVACLNNAGRHTHIASVDLQLVMDFPYCKHPDDTHHAMFTMRPANSSWHFGKTELEDNKHGLDLRPGRAHHVQRDRCTPNILPQQWMCISWCNVFPQLQHEEAY